MTVLVDVAFMAGISILALIPAVTPFYIVKVGYKVDEK